MKAVRILMAVFITLAFASIVWAGEVDLPKTGQTTQYADGDDGDLQAGVAWHSPRFTVGSGAEADCVTDNLTGLMWSKNADLPNGGRTWQGALDYAASLNSGGLCGYTDWRLPNINELESLVHAGQADTASWLNTQGFNNVHDYYWSSTTYAYGTDEAWDVSMVDGRVVFYDKSADDDYVWPVRAGQ